MRSFTPFAKQCGPSNAATKLALRLHAPSSPRPGQHCVILPVVSTCRAAACTYLSSCQKCSVLSCRKGRKAATAASSPPPGGCWAVPAGTRCLSRRCAVARLTTKERTTVTSCWSRRACSSRSIQSCRRRLRLGAAAKTVGTAADSRTPGTHHCLITERQGLSSASIRAY